MNDAVRRRLAACTAVFLDVLSRPSATSLGTEEAIDMAAMRSVTAGLHGECLGLAWSA